MKLNKRSLFFFITMFLMLPILAGPKKRPVEDDDAMVIAEPSTQAKDISARKRDELQYYVERQALIAQHANPQARADQDAEVTQLHQSLDRLEIKETEKPTLNFNDPYWNKRFCYNE